MQANQTLYRNEAIAYQASEKLGTAILLPKRQHVFISLVLLLIFAVAIVTLLNTSFESKVKVNGWIINPDQVHNVNHFEASGIVSEVLVENGQHVGKNHALLKVKRTQALLQGDTLLSQTKSKLEAEIQRKNLNLERIEARTQNDILHQERQHERLLHTRTFLENNETLLIQQIKTLKQQANQYLALVDRKMLSQLTLDNHQQKLAEVQIRQGQVRVDMLNTEKNIQSIEQVVAEFRYDLQEQRLRHQAEIESLQLELDRLMQSNEYTVFSSSAGTVTSIQIKVGSDLSKHKTFMKIVGDEQNYRAKLYIPARAIGRIKSSQEVTIRLDAFPYQQFGTIQGQLTHVGQSILMPDELSVNPMQYSYPVFEADVALSQTAMQVDGQVIGFKHGMTFNASVKLNEQNVIEWILAPIYGLKGAL